MTKQTENEICVKCGREYDGKYPCPCGSKKFIPQKQDAHSQGEKPDVERGKLKASSSLRLHSQEVTENKTDSRADFINEKPDARKGNNSQEFVQIKNISESKTGYISPDNTPQIKYIYRKDNFQPLGAREDKPAKITLSEKILNLEKDSPFQHFIRTEEVKKDIREAVKEILEGIENYFDNSELYDYKKHMIAIKEIIKSEMGERLTE